MSATSLSFVLFSVLFAGLHAIWRNPTWRRLTFFVANCLFIASYTTSAHALLPLGVFLSLGYLGVRLSAVSGMKLAAPAFIIATVFLFCYLKKYWFLSFFDFLNFPYLSLGLSYIFFRVLGLIIDTQSTPELAKVSPLDFFNFAVNFPTLIAGPIDRYQNFSTPSEPLSLGLIGAGTQRMIVGFFKVMVLSAVFSALQKSGTAPLLGVATSDHAVLSSLVSFGVYPIYLYCNFSGYCDIVIGVGYFFGKRYPENFNAPFSSWTFIEYWSRWHMTLSNWLRDYVYSPLLLALMKRNDNKAFDPYLGIVAYFVTFFLIGIWHGSTKIFAIYGLLLALGVSVNKLYQTYMPKLYGKKPYRDLCQNIYYRFCSRGLTYTWVSFCLICFWANDSEAMTIVTSLGIAGMIESFIALFLVATLVLNVWEMAIAQIRFGLTPVESSPLFPYARAVVAGAMVFGCIAIVMLTQKVDSDIIYQAF